MISLNNKTPTHYNFHSPKHLLVHAHIPLNFYPKGKLLDYLPENKQSYIGWYVSSYNLSLLAWLEILGWCSTKSVLTCREKVLQGLGWPPFSWWYVVYKLAVLGHFAPWGIVSLDLGVLGHLLKLMNILNYNYSLCIIFCVKMSSYSQYIIHKKNWNILV